MPAVEFSLLLGIDGCAFVPDLDEPEDSNYVALGSDLFRCGTDGGSSWFYRNRSCGGRRGQDPFLYLCHFVRSVFVGPRCAQTLSRADKGWVVLVTKGRHGNAKRNADWPGAGSARDSGAGVPGHWLYQA